MKTIRKNLLLLAFAAGALFVIGNNVLAEPNVSPGLLGIIGPCKGQLGIPITAADGSCQCLWNQEVGGTNRCEDFTVLKPY